MNNHPKQQKKHTACVHFDQEEQFMQEKKLISQMPQDSQKMLFSDSLKKMFGSRDWLRALLEYTIRRM